MKKTVCGLTHTVVISGITEHMFSVLLKNQDIKVWVYCSQRNTLMVQEEFYCNYNRRQTSLITGSQSIQTEKLIPASDLQGSRSLSHVSSVHGVSSCMCVYDCLKLDSLC